MKDRLFSPIRDSTHDGEADKTGPLQCPVSTVGMEVNCGVIRPANPASGEVKKDSLRKNMAHQSPVELERICEEKKVDESF